MTYAIPTTYKGFQMRSRSEAKAAAMFDACRWDWHYEPWDCAGYVPDFILMGPRPTLVEVKPAVTDMDFDIEAGVVLQRLRGDWPGDILIMGIAPRLPSAYRTYTQMGLLYRPDLGWGEARLHECAECHKCALHHSEETPYIGRPCAHVGDGLVKPITEQQVRVAWAAACNVAQWNPPPATSVLLAVP